MSNNKLLIALVTGVLAGTAFGQSPLPNPLLRPVKQTNKAVDPSNLLRQPLPGTSGNPSVGTSPQAGSGMGQAENKDTETTNKDPYKILKGTYEGWYVSAIVGDQAILRQGEKGGDGLFAREKDQNQSQNFAMQQATPGSATPQSGTLKSIIKRPNVRLGKLMVKHGEFINVDEYELKVVIKDDCVMLMYMGGTGETKARKAIHTTGKVVFRGYVDSAQEIPVMTTQMLENPDASFVKSQALQVIQQTTTANPVGGAGGQTGLNQSNGMR